MCPKKPYVWPQLKVHIQMIAGKGDGLTPNPIHLEAWRAMLLQVDCYRPSKGAMVRAMVMEADKCAPSALEEQTKRMT